ncbi:MAG: hypothetical protein ICV58_00100 [Rubrobacteraceae bacterium]|nr:hypothetical protein [Rubrobacteraceae bacterium]MDQ5810622.1 hypothetical protein [Actinomycetota bacterium]
MATLVVELTFKGAPELACKLRAGPLPSLTSVLTLSTVLIFPRWKGAPTPTPARATEATPNTSARITASPTRKTVALPTHITLPNTLLTISYAPL